MKANIKYTLISVLVLAVCGTCIFAVREVRNADNEYRGEFYRHYRIFTPEIPEKMDFAGEQVPLDQFYVRESLDREILVNTFTHSSTILMFKRAARWFPVIEPILKKNNIPDDFKFLALAESNFSNAQSPSGAEGFWQFLKTTGQKYDLEITDEVDERYNVEKATGAACRYFQESYSQYGNWTNVAASYNRGIEGVSKAMEKQHVSDYYNLYLVDETSRYVFRILAMKQIYNNPLKYGFYLRQRDFYPPLPTYTVTVDTSINDLPAFAQKLNINYKILKEFNPWLRRYTLTNRTARKYIITLPKEGALNWELLKKGIPQDETYFKDTVKISLSD